METKDLVALLAASWLMAAIVWVVRSLRRGMALADALAARYPEAYAKLGAPRPTYFDGVRRQRWFRFVMRQEYRSLDDPQLADRFERYRRGERRGLAAVILSLLAVCLVIWWLRQGAVA